MVVFCRAPVKMRYKNTLTKQNGGDERLQMPAQMVTNDKLPQTRQHAYFLRFTHSNYINGPHTMNILKNNGRFLEK